ncbi:6-phosphogluconolactonase [Ectopseudomonas toyotomiensis]|uniref:6-phosphogluconolactonase n=1 Tax=Ectopseudomonas toyotomiensis TaxID=554344 RepID=A0A1I5YPP3_9GAMM|nr:6-phosphogluconolactonase [Pseudomonas toyotomiensis]PIA66940.1 6-phosphogluconolactonase [Pseudomonas toyotomiensis]SFQ46092.1 6-phosphogluconolactonase [Pseudomonas toyotomiensis]
MAISELKLPPGVQACAHNDAEQLAQALAVRVADALRQAITSRGQATLVVSGGRSPVPFFEALAQQALPWAQVLVSLADERWVPVNHAGSNEALVRRHLLHGPAAEARFLSLYQVAGNLEQAAELADAAVAELAPIDVLVLGMGDDGHTASLFPHSPNLHQALQPDCARRVLPMLAPSEPAQRLTLTLPVLASARLPLLAIQGQAKLNVLTAALMPGEIAQLPIRAFLNSPLEIHWCP